MSAAVIDHHALVRRSTAPRPPSAHRPRSLPNSSRSSTAHPSSSSNVCISCCCCRWRRIIITLSLRRLHPPNVNLSRAEYWQFHIGTIYRITI